MVVSDCRVTYRRGRKPPRDPFDPVALAKKLPLKLRTFEPWLRSENGQATGLREYTFALLDWLSETLGVAEVPDGLAMEVMRRVPGAPSAWYRAMFSAPPQ